MREQRHESFAIAAEPEKHVLIQRLSSLRNLNRDEVDALLGELGPALPFRRGDDLVVGGSRVSSVHILLSGIACRYRMLKGGQRQIVSLLLPGDIVEFFAPGVLVADHSVGMLTSCQVARIRLHAYEDLILAYPNLSMALWQYCLSQLSMLQGWLAHTRRRRATERLAHIFCEQFVRMKSVGLAQVGMPFGLDIAQSDLADATAMSPVHVNRTMQELRSRKLIGRNPIRIEILDWGALQALAEFDSSYLHLRH